MAPRSSSGSSSSIGSAPLKDYNNKTNSKPKRSHFSGLNKLKQPSQAKDKTALKKKHLSSKEKENITKAFKKLHGTYKESIKNEPKQAHNFKKYSHENTLQVCRGMAKPIRVKRFPMKSYSVENLTVSLEEMDEVNEDVEQGTEEMHVEYLDESYNYLEDDEVFLGTKLLKNFNPAQHQNIIYANHFKDTMHYKINEVASTVKLLGNKETKVDMLETWYNDNPKNKGVLSKAWDLITRQARTAWGSKKVKAIILTVLCSGAVVVTAYVGMKHFKYEMDENSNPTEMTDLAWETLSNEDLFTKHSGISSKTGFEETDDYPYSLVFEDKMYA